MKEGKATQTHNRGCYASTDH